VFLAVVIVSLTEPVPPEVRVTALMLSDCDGALFAGDTVVVRLIVPAKPPMLFIVIVENAWELRCKDRLAGFADIVKSPVVKTAVWTLSGTGVKPPFAISTHVVVPATLLGEQPVWNSIGVPDEAFVTL